MLTLFVFPLFAADVEDTPGVETPLDGDQAARPMKDATVTRHPFLTGLANTIYHLIKDYLPPKEEYNKQTKLDEVIEKRRDPTKLGKAKACKDIDKSCRLRAIGGHCQKHREWMEINCGRTCNFCEDENKKNVQPACKDIEKSCLAIFEYGECQNPPEWMKINCARTCYFCGDQSQYSVVKHKNRCEQLTAAQCQEWAAMHGYKFDMKDATHHAHAPGCFKVWDKVYYFKGLTYTTILIP